MTNRPTLAQLTDHARQRAQQRGIPQALLAALLRYGATLHRDGHGARVIGFTHGAREQARRSMGREAYAKLADRLDVYAVVSNDTGCVITVGHREMRLRPGRIYRGRAVPGIAA